MNNDKDKDKKNKGRFLSPSFRKGAVKEKKEEEEDDGEFKINLIAADDDDESKSPSPAKHRKKIKKDDKESINLVPIKEDKDKDKEKKDHHRRSSVSHTIPEDCKVNALPEGRIKKVGSLSQAGKGEDGFTKVNQDSFLVLQNQYNFKDVNIFSVMDGHGVNGHLVSRFVTKYFTSFFKNNKKMNQYTNDEETICYRLKKNDYDILKRAFRHAERDIGKNSDIDANFSGTTCVMVFQIGEKIICANIGDSRAIIVKGNNNNELDIKPLSIDQKPDDPEESKRIIENGGEIAQFEHVTEDEGVSVEGFDGCRHGGDVGVVRIHDDYVFLGFEQLRAVVLRHVFANSGFSLCARYAEIFAHAQGCLNVLGVVVSHQLRARKHGACVVTYCFQVARHLFEVRVVKVAEAEASV